MVAVLVVRKDDEEYIKADPTEGLTKWHVVSKFS